MGKQVDKALANEKRERELAVFKDREDAGRAVRAANAQKQPARQGEDPAAPRARAGQGMGD